MRGVLWSVVWCLAAAGCVQAGTSSSSSSSSSGTAGASSSSAAGSKGSSLAPSSGASASSAGQSSSAVSTQPDGGACAGAALNQNGACTLPDGGPAPDVCCAPFDCVLAHATCERLPPLCEAGQRPSIHNLCFGPCVEEALCAATPEALCLATRGTWKPLSCGDYTCGMAPACNAIIPGCDCGPARNFVVGEGCALAQACLARVGQSCGGLSPQDPVECEPGLRCVPDEDAGVPDVPGTCVLDPSYVCNETQVCPTGASCCYPCGIPDCAWQCEFVDGNCPMRP